MWHCPYFFKLVCSLVNLQKTEQQDILWYELKQ